MHTPEEEQDEYQPEDDEVYVTPEAEQEIIGYNDEYYAEVGE